MKAKIVIILFVTALKVVEKGFKRSRWYGYIKRPGFMLKGTILRAVDMLFGREVGKKSPVGTCQDAAEDSDVSNTGFAEFLDKNSSVWSKFLGDRQQSSNKFLLVDGFISHPNYLIGNAIIANYLLKGTNLCATAILSNDNQKIKDIFRSYGIRNFWIVSNGAHRVSDFLSSFFMAFSLFRSINKPEDIPFLEIEGVRLGDLVYDQYLEANRVGTINTINDTSVSVNILLLLINAIWKYRFYKVLFEKHNISMMVQTETNYVTGGLLARVAAKHGAVIYTRRWGPDRVLIQRHSGQKDNYFTLDAVGRITHSVFSDVYKNYRSQAIKEAERYLQGRFSGSEEGDFDVAMAFSKDIPVISREDLCKRYGWSSDTFIACIMAHVFVDAVYGSFGMLFRDYLTWLRVTLEAIRQVKHVNWLIKPHPTVGLYTNCQQTVEGEYKTIVGDDEHIKLWPDDANSSSLLNIADAIVTVRGSAGLEYSCHGIPCVMTGAGDFNGFGFTVDPQSVDEYLSILENIHQLGRLDACKIEKAKALTYAYFKLCRVKCNLLPHMSFARDFIEEEGWKDALTRLAACKPEEDRLYEMMRMQAKLDCALVMNYDWLGLK